MHYRVQPGESSINVSVSLVYWMYGCVMHTRTIVYHHVGLLVGLVLNHFVKSSVHLFTIVLEIDGN